MPIGPKFSDDPVLRQYLQQIADIYSKNGQKIDLDKLFSEFRGLNENNTEAGSYAGQAGDDWMDYPESTITAMRYQKIVDLLKRLHYKLGGTSPETSSTYERQ